MSMKGTRIRFPRHRKTVMDILDASKSVPSFPLHKSIHVASLDDARRHAPVRIGWTAIFAKAYACVCQEIPELRQMFVRYPYTQLYQHPHSVCSVSVHRPDENGIERLIWGRLIDPESLSLERNQAVLSDMIDKPIAEIYREGLILERFPKWIRKITWWVTMNWAGRKHAKHIGTFSISSLGGMGCLNAHHPLVTTSSLAFGPIDENGFMDVVLLCDHRVIDGMLAAKAVNTLEHILQKRIVRELNQITRTEKKVA